MEKNQKMTIEEVSELIGDAPAQIRVKCRYGMYDPPICRIQTKPGAKTNRYVFYRPMVERYINGQ